MFTVEWIFCPGGITPNSGLTGLLGLVKYAQKYGRQGNSTTHCNAVDNENTIDRWRKGCILPFPKKGDLGIAKNYRGITLTSIAAKIYNALK